MRPRAQRLGWCALLPILVAGCRQPVELELLAADGGQLAPLAAAPHEVVVVVFTSHECPIANALAPTLASLAGTFRDQPVRWSIVHVDPDLTAAAAAQHARDYALPGRILLDPQHRLVQQLGARRTPEAFVIRAGTVHYRGAIDDQWAAIGARAQAPNHQYLRDAVQQALAGQPAVPAHTEPVGCLLPEPRS